MPWDSPLTSIEDIVGACADLDDRTAGPLHTTRVVVELPIELQTRTLPTGEVRLDASPVRQAVETRVMPVLHRIRLGMEAGDGA